MTGQPPPLVDDRMQRAEQIRTSMQKYGIPNSLGTELNTAFGREFGEENAGILGTTAVIGKKILEAPMGLLRGAQWLNDTLHLTGYNSESIIGKAPTDLMDVLPETNRLRLESRLAQAPFRRATEIVGDIVPLVASGGTAGIIGKVAGAPGEIIGKLGAPVAKFGEKLLESAPKLGTWAKIAEKSAILPGVAGSATGFGLYNFVTTDGDMQQRIAALGHGAWTGGVLHVLGTVANVAESAILSKTTSLAEKRFYKGLREDVLLGRYGDVVRRLEAKTVGAAIEATGFAGLSKDFWTDAFHGVMGDKEALGRAMDTWAGSMAAVLMARSGKPDLYKTFRREAPEFNTLETRLIAEGIRDPQKQLTYSQDPQKQPQEPQAASNGQDPADETAYRLPAMQKASDPLFKSGWDMKPGVDVKDGVNTVTMQFPGAGEIRMWENETQAGPASEGFGLEVPVDVFRQVRGDVEIPEGTGNIRMVGAVAEEFSRDLAALSMLRRIRGDIMFGGTEAWAGGPWIGKDGGWHTIGLDGKHYTQGLFPEDGYTKQEDFPLPANDNGAMENPQIARWVQLAQALRNETKQNPGLDLLEASLMLTVRGNQNSRSVQELQRLFGEEWQPGSGVLNADLATAALRPDNIEQFGLTIGQVAAGHLTAEQAAAQIGTVLMGPSKGTQLQAPEGDAAKPSEEPPASIAGSRDWFGDATPPERRDAARTYAKENPGTTPKILRDTFGVPRETARDILAEKPSAEDRSGEAGFVATDAILATGESVRKFGKTIAGFTRDLVESQVNQLASRGGEAGKKMSDEFREVMSRQRSVLGAAGAEARKAIDAAKSLPDHLRGTPETVKNEAGTEYQSLRWIQLAEGRVKPANDAEATVAEGLKRALLTVQHTASGAGGLYYGVRTLPDGTKAMGYMPSSKMGRAVVPRQYSSDERRGYFKMMENDARRMAWFEHLAELNPSARGGENAEPITADKLEAAYQLRIKNAASRNIESPEHTAAYEMQRMLRNVPAVWTETDAKGEPVKTWEILEPDPAVAIHRILERQSGRVAIQQVHGQDLPKAVKEEFGIEKPGLTERIGQFGTDLKDVSSETRGELTQLARDLADRIQGTEPHPAKGYVRSWNTVMSLRRAVMAWNAGIYDIPQMVVEPVMYTGFKNQIKTLLHIFTHKGWILDAQKAGTLAHELGNLDLGVATTPVAKLAELLSAPSNWLEKVKTAIFDRNAKFWVEDLMKGASDKGDLEVLIDYFKFSPEDAQQLVDGTADQQLYKQLRHEVVQTLTSRGRMTERSPLAASPTFRAVVDFVGYSTKRAEMLLTETAALFREFKHPDAKLGELGRRLKRVLTRATGITFSAYGSTLLAYLLADLFRHGDPVAGWHRFWRDHDNFTRKFLTKAIVGQVASGPIGVIASASTEGSDAVKESGSRLISPYAIFSSGYSAIARGGDPISMAGRIMVDAGFVPRQARDALLALKAASMGHGKWNELQRAVGDFKRFEGIKPMFSEPQKQADFYAAMKKVGDMVKANTGTLSDLAPKAEEEIRKALDLQPRDSVAAKLRSMAVLSGFTPEQKDKLLTYLGPEFYQEALVHDDQLMSLARDIDKGTGTYPTEWSKEITMASRQADVGATHVWRPLMERAVKERGQAMASGVSPTSDIEELAAAMADRPQSWASDSVFGEGDLRHLVKMSRPAMSHAIERILMERSFSHRDAIRLERRQKSKETK